MRNALLLFILSLLVTSTTLINPAHEVRSIAGNDSEIIVSAQELAVYDDVITEHASYNIQKSKSAATMKAVNTSIISNDAHLNRLSSRMIYTNYQMLRNCSVIQHSSNYL
ncbi:hypothetical protein SAMN04487944_10378 [Gracilibacillus ureilyticus]|uniref:Uncharacterized protein n=1 Tax=Gracilibacillus ureilyticus TaxID=531814 RepID=A0A1H9NCS9_9BACI|nr:hypothetical protein [Gracilibacillus ureilyticus]SER33754.1 hypothetical protein SAMN04487944_10378 [Gracilibacillus ureilyticus]